MKDNKADYTNTFIYLMNNDKIIDKKYSNKTFWKIKKEIDIRKLQKNKLDKLNKKKINYYNPLVIPRNYMVEEALSSINNDKNFIWF